MTNRRILFIVTAALPLAFALGCTKAERDADADIVQKEVGISMADGLQTKTALYQYGTGDETHPVGWAVGDRIWCYSQSGVYMDYTLKSTDLSGTYSSENSRTHIVYRYGDQWVVCYCKGSSIGDYVGVRKKELLVLGNGIPRVQTGRFEDSHVCIVRAHPDEAVFAFDNVQAFLRFEVTDAGGAELRDGKLLGHYVTKITVESCKDGERMSGNLEIQNIGGWRTSLQDGGSDDFNTISVIPEDGHFIPSPSETDLSSYFVAVPARNYSQGILFNLYTHDGVSEAARGYVEVPAIRVTCNQILNCHDLLKYCAFYVDGISLDYGDATGVETLPEGIQIMEGHTGTLIPHITPVSATDKSLLWETSDSTAVIVDQTGNITGVTANKTCRIKVTALDRSVVYKEIDVTVTPSASLEQGGYTGSSFPWPV